MNAVQADDKITALRDLRPPLRWHLVGHLQGNKARRAAALFDLVHSLDSVPLASLRPLLQRAGVPAWLAEPLLAAYHAPRRLRVPRPRQFGHGDADEPHAPASLGARDPLR